MEEGGRPERVSASEGSHDEGGVTKGGSHDDTEERGVAEGGSHSALLEGGVGKTEDRSSLTPWLLVEVAEVVA